MKFLPHLRRHSQIIPAVLSKHKRLNEETSSYDNLLNIISYLQKLDKSKPVIASGDYNVAHTPIDLKHPENNHHNAGFTDEERQGFDKLLKLGFTDTFRKVHGNVEGVYSWWAQRVRTSKDNNSGWRIDYYIVSDRIADQVTKSEMIDTGDRKDHCPIMLEINL